MTTEIAESTDAEKTYTVAEFMALPNNGKRYELIEGELTEMPGPSYSHGQTISNLVGEVKFYLRSSSIGRVFSGTAFALGPKNAPVPDVAFVVAARMNVEDEFDAFPGPPDLAVEVLSRTDYVFDVDDKVERYLKAGVRLVWVINPRKRIVEVYHPATGLVPQIVSSETELDGEDLLPGFKLAVKALFE
jgi:Uma2 family endonuclease